MTILTYSVSMSLNGTLVNRIIHPRIIRKFFDNTETINLQYVVDTLVIPNNCTLTFFCNDFTIFVCKKMQLKSIFAPFFDGSQSNLIGIETVHAFRIGSCVASLSIEPYWN